MLNTLIGLPVPAAELVAPAVGIEPAMMVSMGNVAELPRQSAQFGHTMPEHLRPPIDDAVALTDLRTHGGEVAIELAARLLAERKAPSRSR
jgi:hypothetical protein